MRGLQPQKRKASINRQYNRVALKVRIYFNWCK